MSQHSEAGTGAPSPVRRLVTRVAALGGGVSLLLGAALAGADPCCSVISVNARTGAVTAFERESGNIFKFTAKNASAIKPCQLFEAELAGLTDGKSFAAKFGAGNLSRVAAGARVTPATPCCTITSAPGTAGRVLGVQPHSKYEGVEILLMSLERSKGDLVTATCLYCNGGSDPADLSGDIRARSQGYAKLLDTENQVEYQVERPGGGDALVSDHGSGLHLQPNKTARTWMKFTAPEGTTATLVMPGASEPFEDVPITAKLSATPSITPAAQVGDQVNPADPCCGISAVNSTTGVVTATETATGRVFQFNVTDRALLGTLTRGQKVWADFGTGRVRIHGADPCCPIVTPIQR
ncbi:MAG: hypothetical protein ACREMZ_01940 [Gemmatimonadales bacterium]